MCAIFVSCAAAVGLWHSTYWGYRLAVSLLAINLVGDIANMISGTESRAVIGISVVVAI
jgi:uncharacterized membrane protein (DUF2068 family)